VPTHVLQKALIVDTITLNYGLVYKEVRLQVFPVALDQEALALINLVQGNYCLVN